MKIKYIIGLPYLVFFIFGTTVFAIPPETCFKCHNIKNKIVLTPHSSSNGISCEDCHGKTDRHIKDPNSSNVISFTEKNVSEINKICLKCHTSYNVTQSRHFTESLSCLSCHSMFHSMGDNLLSPDNKMLLKVTNSKLCLSCHKTILYSINLPYHHPRGENEISCSKCHDPHKTKYEIQTRKIQSKCKSCHPETSGPFMFPHVGAENGGCVSCHNPHGSTNQNLLTRNTTFVLCLSCHSDTPSFHDLGEDRYRNCTLCHSQIHGSNMDKNFME